MFGCDKIAPFQIVVVRLAMSEAWLVARSRLLYLLVGGKISFFLRCFGKRKEALSFRVNDLAGNRKVREC